MKNTIKLLGIIALIAVIGFSMTACPRSTTPAQTQVTETEATGLEKLINEYEALVNEYLEVIEAEGDVEELGVKLEELFEQIEKSQNEFTQELEERFLGINRKVFGF